jgi:serine/threonine protein kinase
MAPEQFDGQLGATGPRTDLYSLGIVAYEMLAGHPPFEGSSTQIRASHLLQEPPPLTGFRTEVSEVLSRVLAKKPEHRFSSCRAFVAALNKAVGPENQEEQPPPAPAPKLKAPGPEAGKSAVQGMRREGDLAREVWRPEWLRAGLVVGGAGLVLLIWLAVWGKTTGGGPLAPLFSTPAPTSTATATRTATPAPTRTPTFTATVTPTVTATSTTTQTATLTRTPTPVSAPTRTPAPTPTATPSAPPPAPANPPPPTLKPTNLPPSPEPTNPPPPPEPTSPPPPTRTPGPAPTWTPPV